MPHLQVPDSSGQLVFLFPHSMFRKKGCAEREELHPLVVDLLSEDLNLLQVSPSTWHPLPSESIFILWSWKVCWENLLNSQVKHQLCVFADWDLGCALSLQAIQITLRQDIHQNIQPVTGKQRRRLWREKPNRWQRRRVLTTISCIQLHMLRQMLNWINPGHVKVKFLRSMLKATLLNKTKISPLTERVTCLPKWIPLRRRCRAMLKMESQKKVRLTKML